ncbi:hypothetical protein M9H77_09408 [Catharanthus roseus]|uniref:Uncharacterized protein n=1 Tax=Catharanthus roseus TaxID=4058 RepID=A0ACC0C0F9_CATRO|nr:hypothetical protein M9H77_09408 [Catharanthus roseus]
MASENVIEVEEAGNRIVQVAYLDFKLVMLYKEPIMTFQLDWDEVAEPEEPSADIRKGWRRITKQRPTGAKDNMYQHPSCSRQLRSLKEIKNFIHERYRPSEAEREGQSWDEIGAYILLTPIEASPWDWNEGKENPNPQGMANENEATSYNDADRGRKNENEGNPSAGSP